MQRSAVIAASAGIDGRADEWDRRAACVSAKATTATETKVTPSTWSPACAAAVCREGTGRNQGDPETAIAPAVTGSVDKVFSRNGWPRPRKSEGLIVLRMARQQNRVGGKGPCFSREVFS